MPVSVGLEKLGIAGSQDLKNTLVVCDDPLQAIEEFQDHNRILLDSLKPALRLLDLLSVHRYEFHRSVVDELKEKLIGRVDVLMKNLDDKKNVEKLEALLDNSFPVIKNPVLQPVVFKALQVLPKIKDSYLKQIIDDKDLYRQVPIEVKRHIWKDNQDLFSEEISPIFDEYLKEIESQLLSLAEEAMLSPMESSILTWTPKYRRTNSATISRLSQLLGTSSRHLHDLAADFLRNTYLRTRNVHYCTLRAAMLMLAHESETAGLAVDMAMREPIRKFCWLLDAGMREHHLDKKRARELQQILDKASNSRTRSKEEWRILGDLAMLLADPFAVATVGDSMMKLLVQCAQGESLPRKNDDLLLLLRYMALSSRSMEVLSNDTAKEPKMGAEVVTQFLPYMMTLLIDDELDEWKSKMEVIAKAPSDSEEAPQPTRIEHYSVPEHIVRLLADEPVCVGVALQVLIHMAHRSGEPWGGFVCLLGAVANNARVVELTFLHQLINGLIGRASEFEHDALFDAVLDKFLLKKSAADPIIWKQTYRLAWNAVPHLPRQLRTRLMEALKPRKKFADSLEPLYAKLVAKVDHLEKEAAAAMGTQETALFGLPISKTTP